MPSGLDLVDEAMLSHQDVDSISWAADAHCCHHRILMVPDGSGHALHAHLVFTLVDRIAAYPHLIQYSQKLVEVRDRS